MVYKNSFFFYTTVVLFALTAQTVFSASSAAAMRLEDALAAAYLSNPDLDAARAELREVDESYAQAQAGYRPRLSGELSYLSGDYDGDVVSSHEDPKDMSLVLRQPIYRGGSTQANVKASSFSIKAQRFSLQAKEQDVLLDAVTGYADVLRDLEIQAINASNENTIKDYLEASRKRFSAGDITKTDVSQAESRYANAMAGRIAADANLRASRARFERVIGQPAEGLEMPVYTLDVPASLEAAQQIAENNNPAVLRARNAGRAAQSSTRAVVGELLPQVDLTGSLGRTYDPVDRIDSTLNSAVVEVRATVPFYTGGGVDSRVRQARQLESRRILETHQAERALRQSVDDAWTALSAANAEIAARKAQVDTAAQALQGVQTETDYGARTTLDLLDAEQELLEARTAYAGAARDRLVALYRLLAQVGDLTAEKLHLPVAPYDPDRNFQKVKDKWIGTSVNN
jgi:outer membrane protein/adhesin transport system outer membrane protein